MGANPSDTDPPLQETSSRQVLRSGQFQHSASQKFNESELHMNELSRKTCSICGVSFLMGEFSYGNRNNRSYCKACDKGEKAAYAKGGTEAARNFRDEKRSKWKR